MDRIFGSEWRPGARRLVARVGARVAPSQGPRILMYHRVFRSGHRLAVTPDLFRRHLDLFQDQGLQVVSVRDLLARVKGWGPHCVALSFDDGYLEMGELVADELLPNEFVDDELTDVADDQIGRASCRERV